MKTASTAISQEQVQKAVEALLKFIGKKNNDKKSLIDDEDFLYLVRVPTKQYACLLDMTLENRQTGPI